jgi:nickel transport protein
LARLLEQQKAQLSRELGQIKREMGLLREELGKPGLKEVFAGIGYILGLAGVGLFIHCRKSSGSR